MIINSIIFIVFVLILLRCEVAVERCTVFLYLGIIANVLALGEEADFEALNCQPSTNVHTR